jgi:hypothetical protein
MRGSEPHRNASAQGASALNIASRSAGASRDAVVCWPLEVPVYRENEASRVGAVLERKYADDLAGVVRATLELWLALPALAPDTDGDPGHAEAWAVLVETNTLELAAVAALDAIRDGRKIRPQAYIDITEVIGDTAVQLELAERALDAGWDPQIYLAAPLMRLVEANREDLVLSFIKSHAASLRATTPAWTVVAAFLTTTRVGDRHDLASWFDGWQTFAEVPTWVLHAYAATAIASERKMLALAGHVMAHTVPDVTRGYFAGIQAVDDLRAGRFAEFRATMTAHRDELAQLARLDGLSHPAARYLNRVKHAFPINATDLAYERTGDSVIVGGVIALGVIALTASRSRPANWKTGELLRTIATSSARIAAILPLFVEMYDVERGSPQVIELCRKMSRSRPSELSSVQPAWNRLVKSKTTLWMRVKLALF